MRQTSGFTLIELSVVLALIGVILYGSMNILVMGVHTAQVNSTVATMDAIEKALLDFRVAFGRIPCPADITLTASSANYGVEAANTGTCTGGSPAANFIAASGAAEGGVPTRALRLPDSYMYDGWGHKFRYAVNPDYTVTTSTDCSLTSSPGITVNDASGAARSTKAIYAIVSHGTNGHGAYTSNGVVVNAGSTNADEQTNCHCDNTGAHTGGAGVLSPVTYVQKYPTVATAGNPLAAFDDIVSYKEAWQEMTPNLSTNSLGCAYASYYRTITLDHTKVPNTDQTSFPVLFSGTYSYLATIANGGSVNNANGYDIIFTSDAAGAHLLPFEHESYNATTGAVVFWVQVPTVSHSADTVIYLQYGNPNITTDRSNKTGTWSNSYAGVWHLDETSGTQNDSTSNANNSTSVSVTTEGSATGKIGGADQFTAGSSNKVTIPNSTSTNISGSAITISAWINLSSLPSGTYAGYISKISNTPSGYRIVLSPSGNIEFQLANGSIKTVTSSAALSINTLYYVVSTYDGTTMKTYINGSLDPNTTALSGNISTSATTTLNIGDGHDISNTYYWNGIIDEPRISNIALSADWIATEYNNQNSPSTFYTVGAQTSR